MKDQIPTHEFIAPRTKKKIVMRDWITGYDDEKIQAIYYQGGKIDKETGNVSYSPETMQAADHLAIELVVVSVEGITENIVDEVLKLPSIDCKKIVEEVKNVTNPLEETA